MATNPHDVVSDRFTVQDHITVEERITWSEWVAQGNRRATIRLLIARILLFLFSAAAIALSVLLLSQ